MIYLTRMLGKPVVDAGGERIGVISDIAISTGEVFPRVTSLAFLGPDKTPFMLSWRKFVADVHEDRITLSVPRAELRFSYLQPDEVLLSRDLLDKQIVDTQGMRVVRVNDLKLSESRGQLRLLGAEVGARGLLRGISPVLETVVSRVAKLFGTTLPENIIAWNYMDLLERDLSHVKLSVTHKRLHELHPADVADVLEQLSPSQRARVFEHLDNDQAADAISELEDELQAGVLDDLTDERASDILEIMDPDDAADILGDLPYDKAETLLHLMGVREARTVRKLLGYKEKSAGGIMTPEVTTVTEDMTVQQVLTQLRGTAGDLGDIYYIYVVGAKRVLDGVISLRDLIVSSPETRVADIVERELFTVGPDDDQEQVADMMSKYDLLALPVVDEAGRILGIVTVDDALDVLEQESAEDLALAAGRPDSRGSEVGSWLGAATNWVSVWVVAGVIMGGLVAYFRRWEDVFIVAALFVPLVMRASDQVAGHSLGLLIDPGEESSGKALQRLGIDLAAGTSLGTISGLVALALLQMLGRPIASALWIALAVAATVFALALVGTLLPLALRRKDGTWRTSATFVSALMSAGGVVLYLALAVAFTGSAGK
ncbi:MAG TPA: magnesium transporter [Coriobacteriia bacterium]